MKSTRMFYTAFVAVVIVLTLAACGNSGSSSNTGSGDEEKESSDNNHSITVTDAAGEKQLDGIPQNIVVLEWTYVEDLLALGVNPAGVADIKGYQNYVNIEPELPEDVQDVGTRPEPSLEKIAKLNPDLIITTMTNHKDISGELNDIAPTLMFQPYPEKGGQTQYEEMETTFNTIAKAVGKQDKAKQVLSNLDQRYDELKTRLSDAGLTGTDILLSQTFSSNETATLRLFTDNAMIMEILNKIGLKNAYEASTFQAYGFATSTVEDLAPYQNSNFMHITQEDDNVIKNQLAGNAVWENLDFVEQDRIYALPGNTWTFGGPLSAEVFAEEAVKALTGE
ncbi:ABC transporter substrate-binding protein [Salibacterium qingdaonense]|uniref:Iron complex transport system substrate-binding protein n=1 Tax=Salibacterium qingdaonense TaxID=266892 RepID=A0A1I4MMP4_9BACI|nr:iron-siderophore ABC transporter substrate-binding protein [Salibacterium qingdaonense]SFM04360.1 iron complex transport system substrate-binding protein [Salibacterium qingdaonense]